MAEKLIAIDGIMELAALGAILANPANVDVDPRSLFWDHATETLMKGPEGNRTAVTRTGTPATPVTWLNCYGTSYSPSQEETTNEAPLEWGDVESKFGDQTDVTAIIHSFSFEGLYHRKELFWKSIRTTKDQFGKNRLYYARFFPEGKKGTAEVWHGVVENRNLGVEFSREDYSTMSLEFPYKSRAYVTDLPTVYPPA